MMQNHVIYSDDPQAVEKLQAKLDKLTAMHARMKEINAYSALPEGEWPRIYRPSQRPSLRL